MKHLNQIFLVLALAAASVGGASASVADDAPSQVADQGTGKITFYRPSSLFGIAMRPEILLDGEKVGKSQSGKRFTVDVPAGTHRISVPNSMYSGERTLEVAVQSGEIVYVRTSLGGSAFGGRTNVEQIDPAVAAGESEKLKDVSQ